MYNCKSCETAFRSISTLRKHQWKEHRHFYANTGTAKNGSLVPVKSTNNNMGATELLDKLIEQKNLLDSTIALIRGVMSHHDK